jgi:hypothetical protein
MSRIKKIVFGIVLAFVFTCSVNAQSIVPGYIGRKTFVDYKVSVCPAFSHPTFLNRIMENKRGAYPKGTAEESVFIPFNVTHSLSIERVMGRKFSLSFNYSFAASKEYFTFEQQVTDATTGAQKTYRFSNQKMNIFGHYYTGSLVIYGKNALAPYGKYCKITVGYCAMKGKFVNKELTSDKPDTGEQQVKVNSDVGYYSTGSLGLGMSFGMNRIYKDRIIFNRGVGFFLPNLILDRPYPNPVLSNVKWTIVNRLHFRDIATFFIGCGYLF